MKLLNHTLLWLHRIYVTYDMKNLINYKNYQYPYLIILLKGTPNILTILQVLRSMNLQFLHQSLFLNQHP